MSRNNNGNYMSTTQMKGIDHVEYAFRAIDCLSDTDRLALQKRFNDVFGKCTPPLTLTFSNKHY